MSDTILPRGIRNNNPMNIRKSASAWVGKIIPSADPDFEQFDTAIDGIRAGAKIFVNYYRLYQLSTVAGLIGRWAPSNENDTQSYIDDVCSRMGVAADACLDLLDTSVLQSLVIAVIWHEEGQQPYDEDTIETAVSLALNGGTS